MNIKFLQKLTLLDYPGKLACTIFLSGCNLRCCFCHNPGLVLPSEIPAESFSSDDLVSFLKSRRGKLDGVCITGGEPTIHPALPDLLNCIHELGFLVKLDTNGSNPQMLGELFQNQLVDYVAMDIKSSPDLYYDVCGGIDILPQVRESIALIASQAPDYEFRTTVFSPVHTPETVSEIAQWIQGAKAYYLQAFQDTGNLVGSGCTPLTKSQIELLCSHAKNFVPNTQIRGL